MREALAFLTVLPVRGRPGPPGAAALVAFPMVGLGVGLLWSAVAALTAPPLGGTVAAVAVVAADLALTGGLHADAVADVGDGLAARRAGADPTGAMRDPGVGALGAAALVVTLLLRVALVVPLAAAPLAGALPLAPVAGRVGMVLALPALPRATGSLAADLQAAARPGVVAGTGAAGAGLALPFLATGPPALLLALAAAALAPVVAALLRRRLAVVSGDVVGAAGVVAELGALVVLAAAG